MTTDIGKGKRPQQAMVKADGFPTRRGFLVGAGAAAGIAGAAAVALRTRGQPAAADVAPLTTQNASTQGRGYHETAHIRKYYETTKV